jgi:hypothetical protein
MIPRIKNLKAEQDYKLYVVFDSGEKVIYDVSEDIKNIPEFSDLKTQRCLFNNVQLDESRTCVFWNDRIDLPSDTLLEYGTKID